MLLFDNNTFLQGNMSFGNKELTSKRLPVQDHWNENDVYSNEAIPEAILEIADTPEHLVQYVMQRSALGEGLALALSSRFVHINREENFTRSLEIFAQVLLDPSHSVQEKLRFVSFLSIVYDDLKEEVMDRDYYSLAYSEEEINDQPEIKEALSKIYASYDSFLSFVDTLTHNTKLNYFIHVYLKRVFRKDSFIETKETSREKFSHELVECKDGTFLINSNERIILDATSSASIVKLRQIRNFFSADPNAPLPGFLSRQMVAAAKKEIQDVGAFHWPFMDEIIGEYNRMVKDIRALNSSNVTDVKKGSKVQSGVNALLSPIFLDLAESQFNITLRALTFNEAQHFLSFLQHTTVGEVETIKSFAAQHGVSGMRMFLSLERGGISGDQIVGFGNSAENAAEIFQYYGQLLDRSDQAEMIVRNEFNGEADLELVVAEVRQLILERAHKTLLKAIAEDKHQDVLGVIQSANVDSVGIAESYLALKKAGLVQTIDGMRSIKKEQYSREDLQGNPDLMENIAALFHERCTEADALARLALLEEHMAQPGSRLTVEWLHGRVIATLLTEERPDGSVYIGSLNATGDHHLQALKIGSSLLGPVVERYATAGKTIEATSLFSTAASYINAYGFVAVERLPDNQSTGEGRVRLLRNDTWPLQSKTMKRSDVLQLLEQPAADQHILIRKAEDAIEIPPELQHGYVLTRRLSYRGAEYDVLERFTPPA